MLVLFGDGDQGWMFWVTSLFLSSCFFLYRTAQSYSTPQRSLAAALLSIPVLMWAVRENLLDALGDHFGWLFLWPGFLLLWSRRSMVETFWASVLLGFAVFSRLELLPGVFLFLVAWTWMGPPADRIPPGKGPGSAPLHRPTNRMVRALVVLVPFLLVYSLVPLHNFVFGRQLVLTTNSAGISCNLEVTPEVLKEAAGSGQLVVMCLARLGAMSFKFQSWVGGFIQLVFLGAWFLALTGRLPMRGVAIFLLAPLPFFLQAFFFTPGSGFPPRHLVASHLVLWLSSIFTLSFWEPGEESTVPPDRRSPRSVPDHPAPEIPSEVAGSPLAAQPLKDQEESEAEERAEERGFLSFVLVAILLGIPALLLPPLYKDLAWVTPNYGTGNKPFEMLGITGSFWIFLALGFWWTQRRGDPLQRWAPLVGGGLVMFHFLGLVSE